MAVKQSHDRLSYDHLRPGRHLQSPFIAVWFVVFGRSVQLSSQWSTYYWRSMREMLMYMHKNPVGVGNV
jgi:hypothetical protein